ncbi:MAG: hypothetical protein JSV88_19750 [Candidatus Aminicenantes bacterium]|nr:MAG: hypothetical protein JSV88_19750 [Candidatus Aminicenantes bacterium]
MSETVKFPNPFWTKEILEGWQKAFETTDSSVRLDMSYINFVNLFDWITVVSMIERVLANSSVESFVVDIRGSTPSNHIPLSEYIKIKKGESTTRHFSGSDIAFSKKAYKLLGFIESLGTLDILNRGDKDGKVYYPGILIDDVQSHRFYSREEGEHTSLLGLTRIKTKGDCKHFLDENRILNWRQAMGTRFQESPIFESEEVWRVLCHEFAVNIWEHSGISGFISMRVVSPIDNTGNIHKWCHLSYPDYIKRLFFSMRSGFLELCIGDAGKGFIETLLDAYINITESKDRSKIKSEDIIAFAFDELGTCKDPEDSWVTERHALNRILLIIAKYGGVLTVRSGGVELIYRGEGEIFQKKPNGWGYEPNESNRTEGVIPGTQFQIILPLIPYINKKKDKIPILVKSLPTTFHTQDGQVRGHLVPLLEKLDRPVACAGKEEQRNFREACENLSKELLKKRPKMDPLVLDFSQLNWTAGQFETLLYYLQNILQHRPVLLVEIDPKLVSEVIQLEELPEPTMLDKHLVYQKSIKPDQFYGELSESKFLETYSGIHATVLGIDRNGYRYIFGLRNPAYKAALLSLVETQKSIKELCEETIWGEPLKQSTLNAILNCINPLFQVNKKDEWSTVWDARQLDIEVKRVMSYHFDNVAERSNAWRGYPYEKEKCKFNLPWQKEWRSNFLECSGILSRERHSDEIAQRLIYRLQKGLEIIGKSLQDVKVLVCVTAPSMLLASFLHRWWPLQLERPAVSDLGYYVMLSHPKDLPSIIKAGGIVIVQHILDTGKISRNLVNILKRQSLEILCIIGFIKMNSEIDKTVVTPIEKGWTPNDDENMESFVPKHAMIEVKRPSPCEPPKTFEEELNSFWIEPHSLRPVRYTTLRRQFKRGRDPYIDRRNRYLKRFDNSLSGCLFAAGHYVYGRRHFALTVDVQRTLRGEIGEEIALWIADICENRKGRKKADWESLEGYSLEKDITAVLMPLHSQIHYIWPKVENLLAQRGRRQPTWLLDATLFSGRGPAYQIPSQFQYQIKMAVKGTVESKETSKEFKNPLRILIIDDAIATGRTAETILGQIIQIIKNEFLSIGRKMCDYPHPIQWIRYFCVLNQMGHARHILWRNLKSIGDTSIKFVFEEYAPFMGTPFYNENECPICRDCERIKHLMSICEQYGIESARHWAEMRLEELQPIAIDSPGFNISNKYVTLKQGIHVLKIEKKDSEVSDFYTSHSSTAIWRFYELMYLSYPPGDILNSLKYAWGKKQDVPDERMEYERYRWAVFEWCLRNWKRVEANTAVEIFISQAKKEIKNNTPLVQPILEACSQHFEDSQIVQFIAECIDILKELEAQRMSSDKGADPDRIQSTMNLYTALALFWLSIPKKEWEKLSYKSTSDTKEEVMLIEHLNKAAITLDPSGHSFLGNLHRQLRRPQRYIDPKWALDTIAESLFRGRDPSHPKYGRHYLLPLLISKILKGGSDNEDRLLLHSSLTLFTAALDDIFHYDFQLSIDTSEIKDISTKVLKWLKYPAESEEGSKVPRVVYDLGLAISPEGDFYKEFSKTFHEEVESLRKHLEEKAKELGEGRIDFKYEPQEDTKHCHVLIHGQRLIICLANLAIDRIEKVESEHKSRIEVFRQQDDNGRVRICFRILTNFESLEETIQLTSQGQNIKADQYRLELFGAKFNKTWEAPSEYEKKIGFSAAYEFSVPSGFVARRD